MPLPFSSPAVSRRRFLGYLGAVAGTTALLLSGCTDDTEVTPASTTVTFSNDTTGMLNYLYALLQLQAAFYERAMLVPAPDLTTQEVTYLQEEKVRKQTQRQALADYLDQQFPGQRLANLAFPFKFVDFTRRSVLLDHALALQYPTLAAFNYESSKFADPALAALLQTIATNEKRHVTQLVFLVNPTATVAQVSLPSQKVLPYLTAYFQQTLDASLLPQ